jgi:DNA-binding transcriptional MerR regulator
MDAEDYTVGAVAGLTGVSVRTLHHYDETGLVRPGGRTAAGYRLYSPQDLQRLQRLLHAMNDRVPAGDPAVMDLAEEHRQHTDRWYHDCGHEMHRQRADDGQDHPAAGRARR